MGCAVSCVQQATMSLFRRHSDSENDARAKLERKLYIAKESPEADFDLSDCQLRRVPSGIFSICKVFRKENLYLQSNKLNTLEDGGQISDLYLIKVLNLSCNKFSRLTNDIRYLVNLTELYIQDNFLKVLPDGIQFMQSLKILDVSNNQLICLTPLLGKLKNLRKLNIKGNKELKEICPEICFASNLIVIDLDADNFVYPPVDVVSKSTKDIMMFFCDILNVPYSPTAFDSNEIFTMQTANSIQDPFVRRNTISWEQFEASVVEKENRIHEAAKLQRERFLSQILQEQSELDSEIAKVHVARDVERQKLIKAIQEDEKEIDCLVKNFIQTDNLKPEVLQQQLAHELAEHDRLLEISRLTYDSIKKSDVLKAMENLIQEDRTIQFSKKNYEDYLFNIKENVLMQEMEGSDKLLELLKAKDQSRTAMMHQFLEDQDVQKAVVASLIERVDARSWSLNEEISLISSHLAKLSVIEQEKKKLQVSFNYNELLSQRIHLVDLLDDLLDQQSKRRKQLIETLKEMESETNQATDFWLKNYQKLMDSAPKTLLNVGKHLDPVFANNLLQEGVIHCLPFLVKFIFSDESLLSVTPEKLKQNGVLLTTDRDGIIRAINSYLSLKTDNGNNEFSEYEKPTAPIDINDEPERTGIVSADEAAKSILESECVICMDERSEVVFVPCGHMCCCQPCANKEMDLCPMCRSTIERKIKVMVA